MSKIFGLLLILVSPFCMGLPWVHIGNARSTLSKCCFAYLTGYFVRLTLFHVIAMPMTILGMHFSTMANVFTATLIMTCVLSFWYGKKYIHVKREKLHLTVYEMIYVLAFFFLLLVQLYITVFMDPTYMTYDDAGYTAISGDALVTNYMFRTIPLTGMFSIITFRFIQSSLLFPAYIVRMTGMQLTMVERTFSYTLNLILAYCCYLYMSEDLYEKRENQLIFLLLISLIYIFGYHSHYSMTFRLLGPNSQGKAILAVILVPFLFVLFRKKLDQAYDWRFGLFLFLLSDAACALSLMGTGYCVAIVLVMVILSLFRRQRNWKHLLYLLWGCVMPGVYAGIYLIMKYYI